MSIITINGSTYSGSSITVNGNQVIIDGKNVTPDSKVINISVNGNIEELKVDVCTKVEVEGSVKNITTKSGDVEVTGDVYGSIQTMSGDVDCGNIQGSVSTMSGDIKHKRL